MPVKKKKEDMAYLYNGILLSHKKETMLFTVAWMDLRDYHTESDRKTNVRHLHVNLKI